MNSRKIKNTHINRNSDKDFEFRYIDKSLNKFQKILNNRIQINILIKYILYNNNLY